jgi:hypothetical protein
MAPVSDGASLVLCRVLVNLPNDPPDQQRYFTKARISFNVGNAFVDCIMQTQFREEHENICVVHDNFDYQEQVHHQIIGSNSVLHHFTTGKVFCGLDIPAARHAAQ